MPPFLRSLWISARALPLYAGLMLLSVLGVAWAGLRGTRLLGDDNESVESLNGPSSRGVGGRSARFYHK